MRIHVSGVNPTDWKRRAAALPPGITEQVPNQDGAGVIDLIGQGVPESRLGQRVWIWEAAWLRPDGTAQEFVVLPERQAVLLPDNASFELGASLGIPAVTAHRTLTVAEGGPERLTPGALAGTTVLVAGGAGAVGNAAIQVARWAGARVITTVSGPAKARLAFAAGGTMSSSTALATPSSRSARSLRRRRHRRQVALADNAILDHAVAAPNATIAFYADDGAEDVHLLIREAMTKNLRWQGVLVDTVSERAKDNAIAAVRAHVYLHVSGTAGTRTQAWMGVSSSRAAATSTPSWASPESSPSRPVTRRGRRT